jgi:hypothetical protein
MADSPAALKFQFFRCTSRLGRLLGLIATATRIVEQIIKPSSTGSRPVASTSKLRKRIKFFICSLLGS